MVDQVYQLKVKCVTTTSFKQVEYFNGTNWFTINYVPEIVKTNLVLSWDTTETSGSGSTGNLLNLNGTSVTSTDNGLTKNNASSLDPSGNQRMGYGWIFIYINCCKYG